MSLRKRGVLCLLDALTATVLRVHAALWWVRERVESPTLQPRAAVRPPAEPDASVITADEAAAISDGYASGIFERTSLGPVESTDSYLREVTCKVEKRV